MLVDLAEAGAAAGLCFDGREERKLAHRLFAAKRLQTPLAQVTVVGQGEVDSLVAESMHRNGTLFFFRQVLSP
jgi:hypothetical protein